MLIWNMKINLHGEVDKKNQMIWGTVVANEIF
jgi:hypothetical protein